MIKENEDPIIWFKCYLCGLHDISNTKYISVCPECGHQMSEVKENASKS